MVLPWCSGHTNALVDYHGKVMISDGILCFHVTPSKVHFKNHIKVPQCHHLIWSCVRKTALQYINALSTLLDVTLNINNSLESAKVIEMLYSV